MKKTGGLISRVAEYDNLAKAFWKAGIGKRNSLQVVAFASKLDKNLADLGGRILSGDIEVGNYRYFKVFEPKERNICASAFKEQVLHHALMNVCHPIFEKQLVYDSYACRKGKGTYKAIERAKAYTFKYRYYLKLDVKKFFDSIQHDALKTQLHRFIKDGRVLDLFYKIIDSYEAESLRGVPIGNLTSQYFANHYLSGLDHYIKEDLGVPAYVRYMDDMVLWSDDKAKLKEWYTKVNVFVENKVKCLLKPYILNYTYKGLPFLGYRIFPYKMTLLHQSRIRFIRKFNMAREEYLGGRLSETVYQRRLMPLLAFILKADTYNLRKSLNLHSRS